MTEEPASATSVSSTLTASMAGEVQASKAGPMRRDKGPSGLWANADTMPTAKMRYPSLQIMDIIYINRGYVMAKIMYTYTFYKVLNIYCIYCA